MSRLKAGEIVDSLDATLEITDGQIVTDLVLVAKVADPEGQPAIVIGTSGGMDWITQLGIVTAAAQILDGGYEEAE